MSDQNISILYDDRGFYQKFGGVSRYYAELIKHLPSHVHWQIGARYTSNIYLQDAPFHVLPRRKEYTAHDFSRHVFHGHTFWGTRLLFKFFRHAIPGAVHADDILNWRMFCSMAKHRNVDIIHLTEPHIFGNNYLHSARKNPFVLTVVDLIPELLMNNTSVRTKRKAALDGASGIIAISQFTKKQIVETYQIPEDKIRVIYLASDFPTPASNPPPLVQKQYILFVGRRGETYKNFPFFIKAIAPLLRSRKDLFLVCTNSPFGDCENRLFHEIGIAEKMIHFPAKDDQMPSLFAHAKAFIYPSKMEGFGIPILDAFQCRCPTILSNCSCFPEIGGDAALFFDDGDDAGLRRAIVAVLDDASIRSQLIAHGIKRAKNFSWENCARETSDFYNEVIHGTHGSPA